MNTRCHYSSSSSFLFSFLFSSVVTFHPRLFWSLCAMENNALRSAFSFQKEVWYALSPDFSSSTRTQLVTHSFYLLYIYIYIYSCFFFFSQRAQVVCGADCQPHPPRTFIRLAITFIPAAAAAAAAATSRGVPLRCFFFPPFFKYSLVAASSPLPIRVFLSP